MEPSKNLSLRLPDAHDEYQSRHDATGTQNSVKPSALGCQCGRGLISLTLTIRSSGSLANHDVRRRNIPTAIAASPTTCRVIVAGDRIGSPGRT